MTKRDAWRTLQTSIFTQDEADRTRSGSETGCQSKHMLHRDKAPGSDNGARWPQRHNGVDTRHDKRETNRHEERQTDRHRHVG